MRPRPAQWLAAVLLVFASLANAQPFGYAAGFNELYRVNLATGQATRLGAIGFNDVEGLALSSGETLLGVADATMMIGNQTSATTDFLARINTTSGAGTLVGQLAGLQGLGPGGNLDYGLAFTCDGRLWLSSDTTGELWEVDRSNGGTRRVAAMGASISGLAGRGNILYGVSTSAALVGGQASAPALYSIDPASGEATRIGPLNAGIVVDDVGLDFDEDGILWATLDPEPLGTGASRVARIDLETGAATLVATLNVNTGVEALAIAPTGGCEPGGGNGSVQPITVPGPGAPALLLLAGLAGWFGRRALRRR